MTIISDLTKSMAEEREAARRYRVRAKRVPLDVARLYRHIAAEEDAHEIEFRKMRNLARARGGI